MLTRDELVEELSRRNFSHDRVQKAHRFQTLGGVRLVVKAEVAPTHLDALVIDPDDLARLRQVPAGVWLRGEHFGSYLLGFPRRRHTGRRPNHFGIEVEVQDSAALEALLDSIELAADVGESDEAALNEVLAKALLRSASNSSWRVVAKVGIESRSWRNGIIRVRSQGLPSAR